MAATAKTPRTPRANTVGAIGDSNTANGCTSSSDAANSLSTGVLGQISEKNWHFWASLYSGGRMRYVGMAATGGYTSAQILSTHLPIALASRPGYCVVLAGTNDVGDSVAFATTKANLTSIYTQLWDSGIIPVLCTLPPRAGDVTSFRTALVKLNHWIALTAQKNGWPLFDLHGAATDASNGDWTSGYNSDNYHLTAAGAKALGSALWTSLSTYFAQASPLLADSQADRFSFTNAGVDSNNLFLTDTNADGLGNNWAVTGSPTTALAADANNYKGNAQAVTRAGGTNGVLTPSQTVAASTGDRIQLTLRLKTTVEASSGVFDVRLVSSPSEATTLWTLTDWTKDIPWSTLVVETVAPSLGAETAVKFDVRVKTANGAKVEIAQFTALNLTTTSLI